jgi:hypothetical protein
MTLIHTCQLCGANSFDYLIELQRQVRELAARPAEWMPWNYRETLAQTVLLSDCGVEYDESHMAGKDSRWPCWGTLQNGWEARLLQPCFAWGFWSGGWPEENSIPRPAYAPGSRPRISNL